MGKYSDMVREPVGSPTPGFVAGIPQNGLVALWDAGISASFDGSTATWKNLVTYPADGAAQTAYDLPLKTPLMFSTGVAGRRGPADVFHLTSAANLTTQFSATPPFLRDLHKSGSRTYTIISAFRIPAFSGQSHILLSTHGVNAVSGSVTFALDSSGLLSLIVDNATMYAFLKSTSATLSAGAWHFVAVSMDTSGTGFFYADGAYAPSGGANTWAASYASPSTNDAVKCAIGYDYGNLRFPFVAGTDYGLCGLFNRALTKTELDLAYDALRGRWSI